MPEPLLRNSYLKSCKVCTRYNTRPFQLPNTPDLPTNRVNFRYPFQHTGIDYTGHFFIEQNEIKIKAYILIFTCMNTRYVHLEVVNSLTIEEFILAFVRFYNRHGFPSVLYYDNARTFTSGSTILSDLIASDTFQKQFVQFNLQHKTIPTQSEIFLGTFKN